LLNDHIRRNRHIRAAIVTALFGVIGVVIGAFIAGGVDLYLERRRERDQIEQAKRLVADETYAAWMQLRQFAKDWRAPTFQTEAFARRYLPTDAWEAHKATLARRRALGDEEWRFMSNVLSNVASIRAEMFERPGAKLGQAAVSWADEVSARAGELYTSLTGQPPDV